MVENEKFLGGHWANGKKGGGFTSLPHGLYICFKQINAFWITQP